MIKEYPASHASEFTSYTEEDKAITLVQTKKGRQSIFQEANSELKNGYENSFQNLTCRSVLNTAFIGYDVSDLEEHNAMKDLLESKLLEDGVFNLSTRRRPT